MSIYTQNADTAANAPIIEAILGKATKKQELVVCEWLILDL